MLQCIICEDWFHSRVSASVLPSSFCHEMKISNILPDIHWHRYKGLDMHTLHYIYRLEDARFLSKFVIYFQRKIANSHS